MTTKMSSQNDNVVAINPEPTFEDWWKLQHHKVEKMLCKAKWDAITSPGGTEGRVEDNGTFTTIKLEASPSRIMRGWKEFIKAWPRNADYSLKDVQYMPRPRQWLNGARWEDYLDD